MALVGRIEEINELNRLYQSDKAELVAIYGRLRVGKTYLVEETFRNRITFRHTGLSPIEKGRSPLKMQLDHFYASLLYQGMQKVKKPKSWMEAFYYLLQFLDQRDDGGRQVVFLDEMPWMDTPKSGFLTAFEGFWNTWGSHRNNLMVIICGSVHSWILDNLINSHGGLYHRVTYQLKLKPFILKECETFFHSQQVDFSRYDITESYMMVGGIPFYLGYFSKELSLAQNAYKLFFAKGAPLKDEYDRLFSTVFDEPEEIKKIVEILYQKKAGLTRKELVAKRKVSDGETFGKRLHALVASDLVIKYVPFGFSARHVHYKLVDPFCLFYLWFVRDAASASPSSLLEKAKTPSAHVWREQSFENVCFLHVKQIKRALGVEEVQSTQSAWPGEEGDEDGTLIDEDGTQIYLVIERMDHVVNMCEMKFLGCEFSVDKEYDRHLRNRVGLLAKELPPKYAIRSTLITTFGLKHNTYSSAYTNVVTLDDLFA